MRKVNDRVCEGKVETERVMSERQLTGSEGEQVLNADRNDSIKE